MKAKFVGGRIVKTGIAVFITAFICHILNWPTMFAVITAIVTIEPTVQDSIKKAFVRFPASALGAAFAMIFTFLLGENPYSYAFVSLSTIIVCHKLKLHDGTLVATLTGVAMISTVHDHYLSSFFIRLGTTSTGLIVSSLVNFLVMPPKYSKTITNGIHNLFIQAGDILWKRDLDWYHGHTANMKIRQEFQNLLKEIDKIETLCHYQKKEWKFHRFNREDFRTFHYEYKKLNILRQITFHIGNLIYLPTFHPSLEKNKRELIMSTIQSFRTIFYDENFLIQDEHRTIMNEVTDLFIKQKQWIHLEDLINDQHHPILPETTILYELLSIYDLTEELSKIHYLERRHHQLLQYNHKQLE